MLNVINKNYLTSRHVMRKQAFSLIELMAVIAIIGILSSIAMPSYRDYMIKAKIAAVIPIKNRLINIIIEHHTLNSGWPTSFDSPYGPIVGPPTNAPGNTFINTNTISNIHYNPTYPVTADNSAATICLLLKGLEGIKVSNGVPFRAATNAGDWGDHSKFCESVQYINNMYRRQCGSQGDSPTDIPVKYLPQGCNCLNYSVLNSC